MKLQKCENVCDKFSQIFECGAVSPSGARLRFRGPRGSSFACGGSVELRAWFCASVRASDALRCVPARRVLKLSRINGVHLSDLLHAQQFLLVRVFGKKKES